MHRSAASPDIVPMSICLRDSIAYESLKAEHAQLKKQHARLISQFEKVKRLVKRFRKLTRD